MTYPTGNTFDEKVVRLLEDILQEMKNLTASQTANVKSCKKCKGTGRINRGYNLGYMDCPACNGRG